MIELGVNIDRVATLRQARRTVEPDPVWAAAEAELGGADGITVHLREDRRHINDRDVRVLRQTVQCKLNLEMSVALDVLELAVEIGAGQATLVPGRRGGGRQRRGMRLHAGHGLNYRNIEPVARLTGIVEVNIGHAIVSRAVFVGLREAVREMKRLLEMHS